MNAKFLTRPITGLERYAIELSLAIQNYQNNLTFLSPKTNIAKSNYDLKKLNLIQIGVWKNYFWEEIDLPLFLRRNKNPLLVNLTNTAPLVYSNQITVIHDVAFLHNPDWYSKKAAYFFKWIVGRSVSASKHIITVSDFSKREIQKYLHVPEEKISVIPEGISTTILSLSKNEYPNKWGNYILAVSTLEPRKNLVNLIKAFLNTGLNDFKLLIAGASNRTVFNDPELIRYRNNERIVFLGYTGDENLAALYKNARLFAYISYYEGFGIPPLEALISGTPVLASNLSSIPEVLGTYAAYCDPFNVEDISEKLSELTLKGERIKDGIISEVAEKYNWERSAQMFLQTITKLKDDGIVK